MRTRVVLGGLATLVALALVFGSPPAMADSMSVLDKNFVNSSANVTESAASPTMVIDTSPAALNDRPLNGVGIYAIQDGRGYSARSIREAPFWARWVPSGADRSPLIVTYNGRDRHGDISLI